MLLPYPTVHLKLAADETLGENNPLPIGTQAGHGGSMPVKWCWYWVCRRPNSNAEMPIFRKYVPNLHNVNRQLLFFYSLCMCTFGSFGPNLQEAMNHYSLYNSI